MGERFLRYVRDVMFAPLVNLVTIFPIQLKWLNDKKYLPLTSEHKKLYVTIHQHMARKLFKFPDLLNCPGFNDRIQWLKLFDQDEVKIQCSDKLLVREHVRLRVGAKYLTELYCSVPSLSDLRWDDLPNCFVVKTNHDSGTVFLVKDKSKFNINKAERRLSLSMSRRYGESVGEWAYLFVKPMVIVEEFISPELSAPPADYKFYCVEGQVVFCHYIYDRGADSKEQVISPDGLDTKIPLHPKFTYGESFVKDVYWDEMKFVAERVSAGFKCVRVDLFLSGGRILVGEMTFWPMAGCYRGEGQLYHGKLLSFDRKTVKPPILEKLKVSAM